MRFLISLALLCLAGPILGQGTPRCPTTLQPHPVGVEDLLSTCYTAALCDSGAPPYGQLNLTMGNPVQIGRLATWTIKVNGPQATVPYDGSPIYFAIDGAIAPPIQLPGYPSACDLHVPFASFQTVVPGLGGWVNVCCGNGANYPWAFVIPNNPALVGVVLYSQALVVDINPALSMRIMLSQAIKITIQPCTQPPCGDAGV